MREIVLFLVDSLAERGFVDSPPFKQKCNSLTGNFQKVTGVSSPIK